MLVGDDPHRRVTLMTRNDPAAPGRTFTVEPPGFRLPDAMRLGAVRLQIADLARSVAYYERVLGLRVLSKDASRAVLGAHGDPTPILELDELRGATPVPRRGRLGLYHFAVLLPDRAALGRFVAHLAALGEYAGMADHLVSEAVYLTDPDGLGIEVYADRPRHTWRIESGVIAMAADPLDTDDLLRASGGVPWTGAPPGTRIGHVHLYVGDLGLAAAFFHAGLGFDRVALHFPGALFLSAGGYHHHLGTNTWAAQAARAEAGDARLLEWRILLPTSGDVDAAARSIELAGYTVLRDEDGAVTLDPWGTTVRVTQSTTAPSR
jgi:catechol 2,3-dioxygenase